MNEKHADNLEPQNAIEIGLQELKSAEQANLFRRTLIDTRELIAASTHNTPTRRRIPIGLITSAAASIILAVGIGGYMFSTEFDALQQKKYNQPFAIQTNVNQSDCDGSFFECVTGPSQLAMANCDRFDYDLDGDVDLTDIKTYQLNCNGIAQ